MRLTTTLAVLFIVLLHEAYCKIPSVDKRGSMEKMKMTPKEYKKVVKMHEAWYAQAVHSLLGAMSRRLIKDHKDNADIRKAFIVCLDEVEEEDAVKESAKCLSHAFDGTLVSSYRKRMAHDRYSFLDTTVVVTDANKDFLQRAHKTNEVETPAKERYSTSFVTEKRHKKRKGTKKVHRKKKHLKKHSDEMSSPAFLNFSFRAKRSITELFDVGPEKRKVKRVGAMPALHTSEGSAMVQTSRMFKNIIKIAKDKPMENIPLDFTMGRIEKLRAAQVEEKTEHGYRRRMLDSVLGKEHPLKDAIMKKKTVAGELKRILPKELQPLSDILKQVPGIEKEGRDRFLSPRFMPLFPRDSTNDKLGMLSPEIMPLYRMPALLNATGMKSRDRNSLISLILETSGTVDIIEEALHTVGKARNFGLGEDLNDITKLMTSTFNDLKGMFTADQHKEFKEKDFTLATGSQLKKLYGSEGMFNVSEFPFDIDEYDGWSAEQKEESLRNTVRLLADDDPGALIKRRYKRETEHSRAKRAPYAPDDIVFPNGYKITFFRHTTLSPYAFSPTINSLAVLGPAVISPSIFSPNIMSPLLLSPPVISPQVGNPLIFSPYVLGPNVMSAAVFNAYVFSPYVLSPNVINPYVMSPLILSPFVLCPDVLSPTVLSGAILSPSVLSPAIYTKNAMSVSVLSPSFLS